jgi:membrane-associated phospholipid phosphatase
VLLHEQHEAVEVWLLGDAAVRERARGVAPAGAALQAVNGVRFDELERARSGHATTAGAAAVVLALAFPRAAPLILPVGFALACTRVAIQAHYLSDICAGLALGAACALVTFAVWRRWWPASVPVVGAGRL